jgi:hypothetical protein
MLQMQHARADAGEPHAADRAHHRVVGLIATLPHWFGFTERVFLTLADTVHEGYTEHPMRAASRLPRQGRRQRHDFSLRRIGESLYKRLFGAAKLVVLIGSLLQLPFLVLQFMLKLLCYLFLPGRAGALHDPVARALATRYVQQTLAVLAWPVGFAITELVAYHLLTAYARRTSRRPTTDGPARSTQPRSPACSADCSRRSGSSSARSARRS